MTLENGIGKPIFEKALENNIGKWLWKIVL
jgi:hypothetical protein